MIIDYSYWRPNPASDLRGVNGVIRYISHDMKKAASAAELGMLHTIGIGTGLVFEDAAERPADGAAAGTADGQFAVVQLHILRVPAGRPLYVACDFPVPNYALGSSTGPTAQLGPVGAYLTAFEDELAGAGYSMGVYGGHDLCRRVITAGITYRVWQSKAWSGNNLVPDACLYQPGVQWHNGSADLDLAGWRDWGQFRRETVTLTGAQA